jgi:hypothetical protein
MPASRRRELAVEPEPDPEPARAEVEVEEEVAVPACPWKTGIARRHCATPSTNSWPRRDTARTSLRSFKDCVGAEAAEEDEAEAEVAAGLDGGKG